MMTQLSHIVLFCCSSIAFRSLFLFLEHRGLRYYEFSLHQRVLLYTGMFVRDNALTWDNMLWLLPHVALFWPLSLTYTVEFGLFCGREQLPFSYAVEYDDVWWVSSHAWFDPVGIKAARRAASMRFLDIRKLVCVYFSHMTRLGLVCFCGLRHDYNSGEGSPIYWAQDSYHTPQLSLSPGDWCFKNKKFRCIWF